MMRPRSTGRLGLALALAWLLTHGAMRAQADFVTYHVAVDSSTLGNPDGSLELQFNPGGAGTLAATATVINFASVGGSLPPHTADPPNPLVTGDVSGSLDQLPLRVNNSTAFNDIVQDFNYGAAFAFDVTISGPAVGQPDPSGAGSTFSLTLWSGPIDDSAGPGPTGTQMLQIPGDPSGAALLINIDPSDGSTIATTGPGVVALQQPASVPEPSVLTLAFLGAAGLAVAGRRNCSKRRLLRFAATR